MTNLMENCWFSKEIGKASFRTSGGKWCKKIVWNRCYEPWRIARDTAIKTELVKQGLHVESHNGSLLWEPWDVTKADGTPYRVFTPFFRRGCLGASPPRVPLPAPDQLDLYLWLMNRTVSTGCICCQKLVGTQH